MIFRKLTLFLLTLLLHLIPKAGLFAQASSPSPYSSQAFDPVADPPWYETPLFWIGMVVFLLLLFFVLRRKRGRSRTFMGPRD